MSSTTRLRRVTLLVWSRGRPRGGVSQPRPGRRRRWRPWVGLRGPWISHPWLGSAARARSAGGVHDPTPATRRFRRVADAAYGVAPSAARGHARGIPWPVRNEPFAILRSSVPAPSASSLAVWQAPYSRARSW